MSRGARIAPAALVVAILAVSFSAIFIRLGDAPAATIVFGRMAITVVLLAPLLARDAAAGAIPRTRRDWALIVVSGVCLAAHFLTWTASLRYTSVASSVLLVSLHPVFVAALGRRLLGEAVSLRLVAGLALALAGTVITTAGDLRLSASALGGDMLAIAGAVTFTGYLLVGRSVRARSGAAGYSVPVYAICALIALAVVPLTGADVIPSRRAALACVGLAVVCTILGHTVFNWTLRHLRAAVVSLAFLGEPPATALLALPFLGERPPATAVAGGLVIIAGLSLALSEPSRPVGDDLVVAAATD
ncbi:MAG TPA: DMT family transporter [Candidatus Dormibacteraeota bacterium]|jgi:drug/metabolite transporter (DMT)-like permease|nr:DMT family transporter [Candidatus Dormibacteraeota bacterium]